MLTTSYFANKRVTNGVAICRIAPKWFEGPAYETLSPSLKLLMAYKSGEIDKDEYTEVYNRKLSKLNCKQVYNELLKFGPDVSMLCYERSGDFCHRRLVAFWFEENLCIKVPELGFKMKALFK